MSITPKFKYNQQVAADFQYQIRPNSAVETLKNAQLFNIVAVYPTKIVKRRPWFGFDRDVRMNDLLKPIIHQSDELQTIMDELESGEDLNLFENVLFDEETVRSTIRAMSESRNFSLHFDVEMTHDEILQHIEDNLHFERLAKLTERISRALKREERGALLKLDVSYSPAFA